MKVQVASYVGIVAVEASGLAPMGATGIHIHSRVDDNGLPIVGSLILVRRVHVGVTLVNVYDHQWTFIRAVTFRDARKAIAACEALVWGDL